MIITKNRHQHMSVNESHNPIYTKLNKILKDLKNLRDCFPRASVLKTTIFSENMDHAHGWGASLGCFHNAIFYWNQPLLNT